ILEHAIHERSLTVPEIERTLFRIFFAERVCSRGVLHDLLCHSLGESVNGMDKPIARTENEVKIVSGQSELTRSSRRILHLDIRLADGHRDDLEFHQKCFSPTTGEWNGYF